MSSDSAGSASSQWPDLPEGLRGDYHAQSNSTAISGLSGAFSLEFNEGVVQAGEIASGRGAAMVSSGEEFPYYPWQHDLTCAIYILFVSDSCSN